MPYGQCRNPGHGQKRPKHRYAPVQSRSYHSVQRGNSRKTGADMGGVSLLEDPAQLFSRAALKRDSDFISGFFPADEVDQYCHNSGGKAGIGLVFLMVYLAGMGLDVAVRFALWSLFSIARRANRKALQSHALARKALHVTHEHARHRPPTPEMLLKYWTLSRSSLEGKILLGSLLGDLSVAVDASYVRGDDGEIVGRQGGIRGWLEKNAPALSPHYKTMMHYKAVADKFRLVCGLQEPDGAEEALGLVVEEHAATAQPKPVRHPKAAELMSQCRTMVALHAALCDSLGLVRVRRMVS